MALSHTLHALFRGFWSKRRLVSVWIGAVAALSAAVVVGALATAGNTADNAGASPPPYDIEQPSPCRWYVPINLDRNSGAALYAGAAAAAPAHYPTHHDDRGGEPTLPVPPPPPPPNPPEDTASRLLDVARQSDPGYESATETFLRETFQSRATTPSTSSQTQPTPPLAPSPERPVPTELPDPVVNSPRPSKQFPW